MRKVDLNINFEIEAAGTILHSVRTLGKQAGKSITQTFILLHILAKSSENKLGSLADLGINFEIKTQQTQNWQQTDYRGLPPLRTRPEINQECPLVERKYGTHAISNTKAVKIAGKFGVRNQYKQLKITNLILNKKRRREYKRPLRVGLSWIINHNLTSVSWKNSQLKGIQGDLTDDRDGMYLVMVQNGPELFQKLFVIPRT